MPIEFYLEGEPLLLKQGLPLNFKEHILRGSDSLFYSSKKLEIILQEVETSWCCFRILNIRFHKPLKLKCRYEHEEKILFARTATGQPAIELIKAGGAQTFKEKQFAVLFGKNWQSLFAPKTACNYSFTDIIWKEELLGYLLKKYMLQEMEFVGDYVPNRINAGVVTTSMHMDKMLHIFRNYNYQMDHLGFLDMNIDRFLTLMFSRIKRMSYPDLRIKEDHWNTVDRAIRHIYDNLYVNFTIDDLSRKVFASPTNLKMYFSRITGFTIDDFKTFMRLRPALVALTTTDKAVKEIYTLSHYSSLSAFCAGFRKVYLCTPTEVRCDEWDTSYL